MAQQQSIKDSIIATTVDPETYNADVLLHARSGLSGECVTEFFKKFVQDNKNMTKSELAMISKLFSKMLEQLFRRTDTTKHFITQPNPLRYVARPIVHPDLDQMYKKAVACFWPVSEIDLSKDPSDWKDKLNNRERRFLSHVLAFFAAFDGIVIRNLVTRVLDITEVSEAALFYSVQIAVEAIHSEMYGALIDALIPEEREKMKLFRASENFPFIKKKEDWALRWMDSKDADLSEILVAFAAVEGIFFSGAFASIFWIKKRNLMPGLCQANVFISRDEGLHRDFACKLLRDGYVTPPPTDTIIKIITEAVEIEEEFVADSLPVNLIGMNCGAMKRYIRYVADDLLQEMGLEKHYGEKNPFDFMINISLENKTNFFENKSGEYQKSGVMHDTPEETTLVFDDGSSDDDSSPDDDEKEDTEES